MLYIYYLFFIYFYKYSISKVVISYIRELKNKIDIIRFYLDDEYVKLCNIYIRNLYISHIEFYIFKHYHNFFMILIDAPIQNDIQEFNTQTVEQNIEEKEDSHNNLCCSKCEDTFLV